MPINPVKHLSFPLVRLTPHTAHATIEGRSCLWLATYCLVVDTHAVTAKQVVRRINKLDPTAHVVNKVGSHHKWLIKGHCTAIIPMHAGDIPVGTLASIRRQGAHCLGPRWI